MQILYSTKPAILAIAKAAMARVPSSIEYLVKQTTACALMTPAVLSKYLRQDCEKFYELEG